MRRRHDRGRPGKSALGVGTATAPTNRTIVPQDGVKGVKVCSLAEGATVTDELRSRHVVVVCCPGCDIEHLHPAAVDCVEVKRQASCGARYTVRPTCPSPREEQVAFHQVGDTDLMECAASSSLPGREVA